MWPVKKNNKLAYINIEGKIVLETDLQYGGFFNEGYAPVLFNQYWGFIDTKGNIAIEIKYEEVGDFYEGFCSVKINNKWGLIDIKGNNIIPPQYEDIGNCSEGLVGVRVESTNRIKYLNCKGKEVVKDIGGHLVAMIDDFSEGLIPASNRRTGLMGYRDNTGKWAIKATYQYAYNFSEGLAGIKQGRHDNMKTGFINRKGEEILPSKYITAIPRFSDCDGKEKQ